MSSYGSILLIDDEPELLAELGEALGNVGFRVFAASCAKEALDCLSRASYPEIIVTDVNLPDMNGIDLAIEMINRKPVAKACGLLFLSGHATQINLKAALKLNAID